MQSFFKRITLRRIADEGHMFVDIWPFRQDFDIFDLVLQTDEICEAIWVSTEQIKQMVSEVTFVTVSEWYPYLREFLEYINK